MHFGVMCSLHSPWNLLSLGTISMFSPMGLHDSNQRCAWDNALMWSTWMTISDPRSNI